MFQRAGMKERGLSLPPAKIQQTKMLVMCQRFGVCFHLGWSGSILQFKQNMIKVGSKSWLLTCSSNITLSLPSYTGSALKREINFGNGYFSLLYFCLSVSTYILRIRHDCLSTREYLIETGWGQCLYEVSLNSTFK